MDIDQGMSVASDGARAVYGDKARVILEESAISAIEAARWIALVRTRGEILTSKRGSTPAEALKALVAELVSQSRAVAAPHHDVSFRASLIGA